MHSDGGKANSAGRRSKVIRLIDEYDLDGIGERMERRWTANDDERMSLRDLSEYFNQRLLEEALTRHGAQPLPGETENTYRLLTEDSVSGADRTRIRRRLERDGIDVAGLLDDFVTYQAIRTYLKEHRKAEYSHDERDRTEVEAENIRRLRGRAATVTESKLEQLRNSGEVALGDFRTLVDITVLCEDCGNQYGVDVLLANGGCQCT